MLFGDGPGASNQFESAGFIRSRAGIDYPDIQFHFLPIAVRYDGKTAPAAHGFQAHVGPMRSGSRGTVRLDGADPDAAPRIRFNYMSEPQDWADFRHCIRVARRIFAQAPFDPYRGSETAARRRGDNRTTISTRSSREHAESAYHPCGTCRMGRADDPMAVVDPQTRVIGVDGLRVADSSIFPRITNGNLNGPSIMVGEKAADHILGRAPLPAENAVPWVNPRWAASDR